MPRPRHTQLYLVLGLRLRRAREAAGFTQAEASSRLEYRQDQISRIETGDRRVDVFELLEFAGLYGVTLADLTAEVTDEELTYRHIPRDRRSPS